MNSSPKVLLIFAVGAAAFYLCPIVSGAEDGHIANKEIYGACSRGPEGTINEECSGDWRMSESPKEEFNWKEAASVYDFTVKDIKGEDVSLKDYAGKVLLIVNVASLCGLTSSNYKELTALDEKYRDRGLQILAFPCNQFGSQEPGSNEDICAFRDKKQAKFTFFDKIDVNGDGASPLWKYLKHKQGGLLGSGIKWNFTKFLVDKNGQPVDRFGPMDSFSKIEEKINKYL